MSSGPELAVAVLPAVGNKSNPSIETCISKADVWAGTDRAPSSSSLHENGSVDESAEATPDVEATAAPMPKPTASRPSRP
jgi:hypothetical protein